MISGVVSLQNEHMYTILGDHIEFEVSLENEHLSNDLSLKISAQYHGKCSNRCLESLKF